MQLVVARPLAALGADERGFRLSVALHPCGYGGYSAGELVGAASRTTIALVTEDLDRPNCLPIVEGWNCTAQQAVASVVSAGEEGGAR